MTPREVRVSLPGRAYSVWVGADLLGRAHELIPLPEGAEIAAVVADANAAALHAERLESGLAAWGVRVERFVLPPGEGSKTLATIEALLRWLAATGAHRGDLVVALGGGVAGDIAGLAAALYARGVALAQVPTTVVGQVDAAIGGKCGVNLPEGKNLAGAFHQPVAVLADTSTLATLPDADFAAGLAEVVKHGLIDDGGILGMLEEGAVAIRSRDREVLGDLIARAAAVKARVVEADETERGARAFLNYGHTLAHALETLGGYRTWRHGEAVAVGMMFAAYLAPALGLADRVAAHARALEALDLPTGGASAPYEEIYALWMRDKKYRRGMRFVVLEDLGRPRLASGIADAHLRAAYEAVR
ncbi:MAG: 3-dehydroquinate synthase [Acidobacteria bacterium]|nr:3-dehydroquinate synthase [Acidobacteriota bacterium]